MFTIFLSVLTLFVSTVSLFLNLKNSKYSVYLSGYTSKINRQRRRISFTISNTSSHSLVIKNVILKRDNKVVHELDFDINQYDRNEFDNQEREERRKFEEQSTTVLGSVLSPPYMTINTFRPPIDSTTPISEKILFPFETHNIDTFVDSFPDEIVIITNKRINLLSKSKSFSIRNN